MSRTALIKQLHDSVLAAELHYQIYWIYVNRDDRAKYVAVLNRYLGFFRLSIQAHFVAVVVVLYTVYENRHGTVNLVRLYQKAPTQVKATLAADYTRAIAIWKKIAVLRNNHFGHITDRLEADAVFRMANLTGDEIKELIKLSKNILNALSYAEDRSVFAASLDSRKDTYRLLEKLR